MMMAWRCKEPGHQQTDYWYVHTQYSITCTQRVNVLFQVFLFCPQYWTRWNIYAMHCYVRHFMLQNDLDDSMYLNSIQYSSCSCGIFIYQQNISIYSLPRTENERNVKSHAAHRMLQQQVFSSRHAISSAMCGSWMSGGCTIETAEGKNEAAI